MLYRFRCYLIGFFILLILPLVSMANSPVLLFSDLISGPDDGLDDGLGSGVVVTIWGRNLGDAQGGSKVIFTDSAGRVAYPHIYYWKRADGELPGGPANLYKSHGMQEIAFSIPSAAMGLGKISVEVGSLGSNHLPFSVRDGEIFHVKKNGNDNAGNGSFAAPWATVAKALSVTLTPGSTIYIHDSVISGSRTSVKAVYWNKHKASSGLANQFGLLAYPGSHPSAIGYTGFASFKASGQVVSKWSVFALIVRKGQMVNLLIALKSLGRIVQVFERRLMGVLWVMSLLISQVVARAVSKELSMVVLEGMTGFHLQKY